MRNTAACCLFVAASVASLLPLENVSKCPARKPQQKSTFLKSKIIGDTSLRRFQEKISRGIEEATNRQQVAALLPLQCFID